MIKFYKIFWALLAMLGFSACVEIDPESRSEQQPAPNMQYAEPQMQQPQYVEPQAVEYVDEYAYPPCLQETTVVVYDDAGAYQVPGCVMTAETPMVESAPMVENSSDETEAENDEDEEIDPEVVLMRYVEEGEESYFETIDDDDEFERVSDYIESLSPEENNDDDEE